LLLCCYVHYLLPISTTSTRDAADHTPSGHTWPSISSARCVPERGRGALGPGLSLRTLVRDRSTPGFPMRGNTALGGSHQWKHNMSLISQHSSATTAGDTGPLATTKAVADQLGISERRLLRMVEKGGFPAGLRVGRSWRWPVETVRQWIATRSASAQGGVA
jgi:excisionase family DNA binding protein